MNSEATSINIAINERAQSEISSAIQALNQAAALIVSNQEEYDLAGSFIAQLKKRKSTLEKERKEITGPIDDAKKAVMSKFAPHIDNLDRAIQAINQKMIAHYRAEEKKRLEAEAAAAEKARREQEKLQKRAEAAAAKGQVEKAAALQESASNVIAAPVMAGVNKQTAETTIVRTWHADVYDKFSLIKAVAAGEASMSLLDANMPALNKMAQASRELLNIPGVKAVCEETVRAK